MTKTENTNQSDSFSFSLWLFGVFLFCLLNFYITHTLKEEGEEQSDVRQKSSIVFVSKIVLNICVPLNYILFQFFRNVWAPLLPCEGVWSLCLQLTKVTNRCHVFPSSQAECVQSPRLPWQWGLCAVPGASRCALVYCFPSNLHLTFRLTAFLSPFSRLISFEEIIFEPHQRLTDLDDMTHTTRRSRFLMGRVARCHSSCWVLGTMWAGLCSIN